MAGRRKHVFPPAKRKVGRTGKEVLWKRQKKHLKEFGETHPADERDTVKKYTKVEDAPEMTLEENADSSEESEVEETAYNKLVATIPQKPERGELSDDEDMSDEESDGELSEAMEDGEEDEVDEEDSSHRDSSESVQAIGKTLKSAEESDSNDTDAEGDVNDTITSVKNEEGTEDDPQELSLKESDPFTIHFESEIPEMFAEELSSGKMWTKENTKALQAEQHAWFLVPCMFLPQWNIKMSNKIPHIGKGTSSWSSDRFRQIPDRTEKDLKKLHVKHKLCQQVLECNQRLASVTPSAGEALTRNQLEIFKLLNCYQDLYFPGRTHKNGEELRLVYCLHALNHVLKTRGRIVAHNTKIKSRAKDAPDIDYRDQGLTRPKVSIILPFRDSALRVVNMFVNLLMPKDQTYVSNKKRFQSEYSEIDESVKKGLKPEDYEILFSGNTDDHFRIGLGVAKKTLKLYTDFYSSDIILASPLGLRTLIAGDGETKDCDFLSSIEVMIFDQTDVFLMQNWDHILYIMEHLHLQPKEGHGVDFSRVRMWTLNGWAKYYRQTVVLSSVVCPEINSLFNKCCHNYGGKVAIAKPNITGTICQIVVQLPQVFQRISCSSFSDLPDARFEFFTKTILPHHKDPVMSQTLVFIPSYFDFVRVRNYFVKEDVDFVSICEYSSSKVISKSRSMFFHGKAHFLLYTERVHFFRRFKLRGIKHIVFYGLPLYPHFYNEMSNMMREPGAAEDHENISSTVIYSKYDAQKLAPVVGIERAGRMLNSDKAVHMFVTGDT